jgi:hypothetical protein
MLSSLGKRKEKERMRGLQGAVRGARLRNAFLSDGAPPHVQHQGEGHPWGDEGGDPHSRQVLHFLIISVFDSFFSRELTRALQPLSVSKTSQGILVKNPKTKEIVPSNIFSVNVAFTSASFGIQQV